MLGISASAALFSVHDNPMGLHGMKISAEATPTPGEILSGRTTTILLCRSWDPVESCVRLVHTPQVLGIC